MSHRAIIDTNVLVSGLGWAGPPAALDVYKRQTQCGDPALKLLPGHPALRLDGPLVFGGPHEDGEGAATPGEDDHLRPLTHLLG